MELLNTQTNADEMHRENSGKLVEREQSKENPMFIIVGTKEDGYMVTFGKYQLSKKYETIDECEEKIMQKDYEIIFALMGVAIEIGHAKETKN